MSSLRKIAAMDFPDVVKATVAGARPKLVWVKPTDLLVDETYQRDLSRQSVRLIREIVQCFSWDQMKPPITVEVAGGLHVVDGQHTAIAAASINLPAIPIFVVHSPDLVGRAKAFVGHNRRRIQISGIQIHRAMVAAGDDDALDVDRVCQRAGVRLRHAQGRRGTLVPGESAAIATIYALIKRRGVMRARQALEVLAKAKLAPISEGHILAADHLLAEKKVDADDLCVAIRLEGDAVIPRAKIIAKTEKKWIWQAVVDLWVKRIARGQT